MKKLILVVICIIVAVSMIQSCAARPSGTYITDASESLVFKGKTVTLSDSKNQSISGNYELGDGGIITAAFDRGSYWSTEYFVMSKDKKTIVYGDIYFYKELGFFAKHWPKILIGWLVVGAVMMIYEKITGRELDDDIDSFFDKSDGENKENE